MEEIINKFSDDDIFYILDRIVFNIMSKKMIRLLYLTKMTKMIE